MSDPFFFGVYKRPAERALTIKRKTGVCIIGLTKRMASSSLSSSSCWPNQSERECRKNRGENLELDCLVLPLSLSKSLPPRAVGYFLLLLLLTRQHWNNNRCHCGWHIGESVWPFASTNPKHPPLSLLRFLYIQNKQIYNNQDDRSVYYPSIHFKKKGGDISEMDTTDATCSKYICWL